MNYEQIRHRALAYLRALRFPAYELTGTAKSGKNKLRLLYAGDDAFRHYFRTLAFGGKVTEIFRGRTTPWHLQSEHHTVGCDLVIFRSHRDVARANLNRRSFFVPDWLSGQADLNAQAQLASTSRSRKRDLRLLQRNELSYSVTRDPDELGYFYREMYLPQMHAAHGDGALLMSYEQMMGRLQRGETELVLIRQGSQRVAGSLIVYDNGKPRLFSEGILGADRRLMRLGAGTAIYIFSFDYLRKRGFDHVHMGRSRAFLSDGVLYFKERFGMTVTDASQSGVFLRPRASSLAAAQFLAQNPFIYVRNQALRGGVFNLLEKPVTLGGGVPVENRMRQMGVNNIDVVDLSPGLGLDAQRTSNVSVAQRDS